MIPTRRALGASLAVTLAAFSANAQTATQPTPVPAAPAQPTPVPTPPGATTTPPPKADDPKAPKPKEHEWPREIGGRSLGLWLNDFRSTDPTVRDHAIRTIPNFGPEARKQGSKLLIAALNDPDPGVRINAMLAMSTMGLETEAEMKTASETMRVLITRTAPGSALRLTAARTLAYLGPEAYHAISGVKELTTDPWWEVRQAAAGALGRIGAPVFDEKAKPEPGKLLLPKRQASKVAMDTLMFTLLRDQSSAVRMEAAQSLIVLGPPYNPDPTGYIKDVKPYLDGLAVQMKAEQNSGIKVWLVVLEMMYDDRAFDPNLTKLATHVGGTDPEARMQALSALAMLGDRAKPVVGSITAALKHENQAVVVAALTTLVSLGRAARDSIIEVEALQKTTKDEDVRELAKQAIAAIKGIKDPDEKKDASPPPKKP